MRAVLLFLFVFMAVGCQKQYTPSTKEQLANEVTRRVAVQLKKERDLYPIGSGGRMMDQIKMLALSFDYYKDIGIEGGRELLVASVDEFVAAVNGNEQIRPYLGNYPFESKNIEIRIFLRNPDHSNPVPGKLCVLSAIDGVLDYDIRDPTTDRLKAVYKETYDEAKQKLAVSQILAS